MKAFSGYRILLVDDESLITEIIKEDFEERGAYVIACTGAAPAFEAFCKDSFDVVLSDVRMPGMSGIELMQKIISYCDEQCLPRPVLFFCSAFGDHTPELVSRLGISAVFTKPFKLDALTQQVLVALQSRHSRTA